MKELDFDSILKISLLILTIVFYLYRYFKESKFVEVICNIENFKIIKSKRARFLNKKLCVFKLKNLEDYYILKEYIEKTPTIGDVKIIFKDENSKIHSSKLEISKFEFITSLIFILGLLAWFIIMCINPAIFNFLFP